MSKKPSVNTATAKIITAMLIWGSMGIFAVRLNWPPPVVASFRAITGAILAAGLIHKAGLKPDWREIGLHLPRLACAGACVGLNWILLFYGYMYTTVPIATLCYYMAPIYVMMLSPLLFKERLTLVKIFCAVLALCGTGLVSGIHESIASGSGPDNLKGVFCSLLGGLLYAFVMLLNKSVTTVAPQAKTFVQMAVGAMIVPPFTVFTTDFSPLVFDLRSVSLLLVLGIFHTGIAFHLFFSGVEVLPAQTTALLSYIDPLSAIALAALFLGQPLTITQAIGGCMILAATLICELFP